MNLIVMWAQGGLWLRKECKWNACWVMTMLEGLACLYTKTSFFYFKGDFHKAQCIYTQPWNEFIAALPRCRSAFGTLSRRPGARSSRPCALRPRSQVCYYIDETGRSRAIDRDGRNLLQLTVWGLDKTVNVKQKASCAVRVVHYTR